MAAPNGIILFHYPMSPPSRQVVWYLTLLGVEYAECIQPQWLPRPDVSSLGVNYRRIPLMAINRHIYLDSRLLLRQLTTLYPTPSLLPQTASHQFILRLIEKWTQQSVFGLGAALLPLEYPAMQHADFRKDREEMTGRRFDPEAVARGYPEGRVGMREAFEMLERTVLADGRKFLLETQGPTIADIEAIFPFEWVATDPDMSGALPANYISEQQFPRVFAWIHRFKDALAEAKAAGPKPVVLSGEEALKSISNAKYEEPEEVIDKNDPLQLEKNTMVEVFPIETGFRHKDRGHLVKLTPDEIAIKTRTKVGENHIVIHMPRVGFRIAPVGEKL